MNHPKFVALMEKLLDKTKKGQIKWYRISPIVFDAKWASKTKSFSCLAGTMEITILSNDEVDSILFNIKYDKNIDIVSLTPETDEEHQIAVRLINYVYNLFPNLDKAIDQFLMED